MVWITSQNKHWTTSEGNLAWCCPYLKQGTILINKTRFKPSRTKMTWKDTYPVTDEIYRSTQTWMSMKRRGKWINNNCICILPHLNAPYNHLKYNPTSSWTMIKTYWDNTEFSSKQLSVLNVIGKKVSQLTVLVQKTEQLYNHSCQF